MDARWLEDALLHIRSSFRGEETRFARRKPLEQTVRALRHVSKRKSRILA